MRENVLCYLSNMIFRLVLGYTKESERKYIFLDTSCAGGGEWERVKRAWRRNVTWYIEKLWDRKKKIHFNLTFLFSRSLISLLLFKFLCCLLSFHLITIIAIIMDGFACATVLKFIPTPPPPPLFSSPLSSHIMMISQY